MYIRATIYVNTRIMGPLNATPIGMLSSAIYCKKSESNLGKIPKKSKNIKSKKIKKLKIFKNQTFFDKKIVYYVAPTPVLCM